MDFEQADALKPLLSGLPARLERDDWQITVPGELAHILTDADVPEAPRH